MGGKKIQKNIENEKKQWGFQEKKKKRKKWRKKKRFQAFISIICNASYSITKWGKIMKSDFFIFL